ncbi:exosome complex component CSL4 isoform X2 [Heliangelus exortis]|uniref:exosome complex component CSL4 isoform X2 n=1 Tax=Heliangelus exortis TaxID=472823 RepID=UPI003A8EB10F
MMVVGCLGQAWGLLEVGLPGRAAVQRGGSHGRQRDLHPARLHLLLAGGLLGEEERGQRAACRVGGKRRRVPAPARRGSRGDMQELFLGPLCGRQCLGQLGERVCSINSRFAKVHILYVGSTPLKSSFRGTIRREDIRATEKDKISLGDAQSNYLLSTAENELGVVVARSEAGVQMVPISWCEMQCPQTHTKDFRKVARVQPQFLQT